MTIGTENCYEILGISPDANDEEVKQAFRELAKHYHPDRNPGDEEAERQFKRVTEAYDAVRDAGRRQAYNEWLAFSEGRQKTTRRQWGRLVALLALLLIAPSAVISWFAISGEFPMAEFGRSHSGAAPVSPVRQERSVGAKIGDELATGQSDSGEKPAPESSNQHSGQVTDENGAQPSSSAENESQPDNPKSVSTKPSGGAAIASTQAQGAPAEDVEAAQVSHAPAGSDRTEALPNASSHGKAASVAENENDGAQQPTRTAPQSNGGPNQLLNDKANGARGAAQLLAELKEPGNADAAAGGEERPRSIAPLERGQVGTSGEAEPANTFSDCRDCPLMSLTRHASTVEGNETLAISQSEVTVRQWNICVQDGACPPYRSGGGDPLAPVVGVSEHDASLYAAWLSDVTGKLYRAVLPFSPPGARTRGSVDADDRCADRQRQRKAGGWDWLEDKPDRDCPPPSASHASGENARGFRVARRTKING